MRSVTADATSMPLRQPSKIVSRSSASTGLTKAACAAYYRIVLPSPAAGGQRKRIVRAAFEIAPVLRDAFIGFAAPDADIRHVARALDVPIWCAWAKSDRVIPLRYALPVIAEL